jgi:hypothetical protein
VDFTTEAIKAIQYLRGAPVSDDVDESAREIGRRVQPVWLLLDKVRDAVRCELNGNHKDSRPVTRAAETFYDLRLNEQHRNDTQYVLQEHELEFISDLRHLGAHHGSVHVMQPDSVRRLGGAILLHHTSNANNPFSIRRCTACGATNLSALLDTADRKIRELSRKLADIPSAEDVWHRYSSMWAGLRELEANLLPSFPSIYQLTAILGDARIPWYSGVASFQPPAVGTSSSNRLMKFFRKLLRRARAFGHKNIL